MVNYHRKRSQHQESQVEYGDSPSDADSGSDQERLDETTRHAPRADGPACQQCRKKKAKCTREQPCSQCARNNLTCVYHDKKAKPGVRTGAIEHLTQRLATLESMFLGQGVLWQQVWRSLDSVSTPGEGDSLEERSLYLKRLFTTLGDVNQASKFNENQEEDSESRSKRRKVQISTQPPDHDFAKGPQILRKRQDSSPGAAVWSLPDDLIVSLVDIYFERIHPWIPMLHVIRFRQRLRLPEERPRIGTIVSAIVSLSSRFSDDPRLGDQVERQTLVETCRQHVILQSMELFSVENLQALIICAFDTIGNGRGPTSWSIVGSLVRTVEQLGLSVEGQQDHVGNENAKVLVRRINFLPPCRDWIEIEERRRVFWNAFLMDRFCCIATGWNLSLTSADVKRRLPCEGSLWEKGKTPATPTPYFGVSDKANHLNGEEPTLSREVNSLNNGGREFLGGFAYCIEATESLSLVTSFFLQRAVDVTKTQDLQLFLMRFKELDLRLIHWKMFLPEEWREACATNTDGNMDPNLTLAHVTHNTAVVLLHQSIAYPGDGWETIPIKLPSESSADTCLAAAREVAIITDNFLRHSTIPTNPQFSFCLFVCARMLVNHASVSHDSLPLELHKLVSALEEISRRWNGQHNSGLNLASKFASRLAQARGGRFPNTQDIRQDAYADDHIAEAYAANASSLHQTGQIPDKFGQLSSSSSLYSPPHTRFQPGTALQQQESPNDMTSLAFPPLPQSLQPYTNMPPQLLPQETLPILTAGDPTLQQETNMMGHRHPIDVLSDGPTSNQATIEVDGDSNSFNDLSSYFVYSFHPESRVSSFSNT